MRKPLHEPTFLVLTALLDEPLHGYALLAEVVTVSAGRVHLRVGTLYAALDRLCAEGLVVVVSEEVVRGRLRRTYGVTSVGREVLSAEVDRMASLASAARSRLRGRTVGVGDLLPGGGAR